MNPNVARPPWMSGPTRYARIAESPYFQRALGHIDPEKAAVAVYNHMYQLLHYGDPVAEYWSLIEGVTLWDVANERQVEISGPDARRFVQMLVPRDMNQCQVAQCKYVFITDTAGGIIADPVLLRLGEDRFWISTADADVHLWCQGLATNAGMDVTITRPDVAPVQIQGPKAKAVMTEIFGPSILDLGYYRLTETTYEDLDLVISRTGWSTEVGYEVYVADASANSNAKAERWWDVVMAAGEAHGIVPIAPNHVRRIEAGILAHGCDISEKTNPFEVDMGYGWMVDLDQPDDFIGKAALRKIRDQGPTRRLVGVDLSGPDMGTFSDGRMPAPLPVVVDGQTVGQLTSACWSPRLNRNIGYAMVPTAAADLGTTFTVAHPELGELEAVAVPKPHWDPERTTPKG